MRSQGENMFLERKSDRHRESDRVKGFTQKQESTQVHQ